MERLASVVSGHACPEKQLPSEAVTQDNKHSAFINQDALMVKWNGDDDPADPLNWSSAKKWTITLVSSLGGLVCLMSSTMLAPALQNMAEDLRISQEKANMTLSIFVLACAFGPLVLAPMAEVFGRRRVWLICSVWYALWNMACGFARSEGLLLTARLLAGLGSSAEYAVSFVFCPLWS